MGREREFEGKDLEEALLAASEKLGIPEPELDYRIVEQGRRGLMGLGARNVRISVMPPVGEESVGQPPEQQRRRPRRSRRGRGRRSGRSGKRRSGGKSGPPPTEEAEDVKNTLQKMMDLVGLDLDTRLDTAENGLNLHLEGPDRKILYQKDGELISALQFLLNRMAHRAWPGVGRIHLTSDGRRRRRDDELIELAKEVAQQVASTGQPKHLHPMNAYERRLVHIAVREFTELGSRSEGGGYMKRVKIYKISNKLPT
jgi:spoIIIJ-associated protein